MDTPLQHLIAQAGYAYIRNLMDAEAAVRRGQFNVAKVLRVSAYVQRTLALQLARLDDRETASLARLDANISEIQELEKGLLAAAGPDTEAPPHIAQIARNLERMEALLIQSRNSLSAHTDILDTDVAEILWVCLNCGFIAEAHCPVSCSVCGAVSAEFAWFGPFYVETPEHLGRMSPAKILAILERVPQEIAHLTKGISEQALLYRPSEAQWCIKEIVGHLVEIDRLFVKRAAAILERDDIPDITAPGPPWKMHEGKGYEQAPIQELLDLWKQARSTSLEIIQGLTSEQWSRRGALREVTTSLFDLGIWLANHDLAHSAQIRQLCGRQG